MTKILPDFLNNAKVRGYLYQLILFVIIGWVFWQMYQNISENYAKANIASGFGFLNNEASFNIGESIIDYSPSDTYGKAILVGALNTLKISFYGIVLSLIIGVLVGMIRLSKNRLASLLSYYYIEIIRNTPLLLKLFYCYAVVVEFFPSPNQALNPIYGVFLSNRGIKFPKLSDHFVWDYIPLFFILGFIVALLIRKVCLNHQEKTGKIFPYETGFIILPILFPALLWLIGGMPAEYQIPELKGFNFVNGTTLSPEFIALMFGLILHTSAFIAEVIRSGILSVTKGQLEAAAALGLKPKHTMFLVVFPQAFRVIIPPLTNQMLNLTKNSSLAVAVGYPDLVSVANTSINQTGQSVEGIMIIMGFYLFFSLVTSLFMNWFNAKVKLVER